MNLFGNLSKTYDEIKANLGPHMASLGVLAIIGFILCWTGFGWWTAIMAGGIFVASYIYDNEALNYLGTAAFGYAGGFVVGALVWYSLKWLILVGVVVAIAAFVLYRGANRSRKSA